MKALGEFVQIRPIPSDKTIESEDGIVIVYSTSTGDLGLGRIVTMGESTFEEQVDEGLECLYRKDQAFTYQDWVYVHVVDIVAMDK